MSSKRLFSWSKRHSNTEPYYKTGGLLPIESMGSEPTDATEVKESQKARRRPSNLTIIPPDSHTLTTSPLSSPYNGALLSSTSNLMAMFNDMLRSPALSAGACPRSASVHKPLPIRPRSASVPSTPDLPVELPGSLLQRNQGFPYIEIQDPIPSRPTSQNVRRGTHPPDRNLENEGDVIDLLHLFPEPLNHSKSVPSLNAGYREGAMKSTRVGTTHSASTNNRSKPHRVHHRKALSDIEWKTLSEANTTKDSDVSVPVAHLLNSNVSDQLLPDSDNPVQPSWIILDTANANRSTERRASLRNDTTKSVAIGNGIRLSIVVPAVGLFLGAWDVVTLEKVKAAGKCRKRRHAQLLAYLHILSSTATVAFTSEGSSANCEQLGVSLTPTLPAHNTIIENPCIPIASQDQTIATLREQFKGLKASHEAHVSSLAGAHAAEVASLQDYTRLLEDQLAQRRSSLHHDVTTSADAQLASSIDPLISLDTSQSPSTLSRESSQHTAYTFASSTLSSWTEKDSHSLARSQDSPEMESLKRKLSTTRRPQTADRNLLPELNQYKQNNAALQTQISSLMAKLNESKKNEKALKTTLEDVEQRCAEAERQSSKAQQLASSTQALQNTISHLENRLEVANTEKLDAQEELFNMRALKSPFDAQFPELQLPAQNAHESADTVFSTDLNHQHDANATLSKYVAHVDQLQDEIREKGAYIAELENDSSHVRQMLDQTSRQYEELNLQLVIQSKLLGKTQELEMLIEQLRAAILDREAVIAEKERSVRTVERQLEHHKLLLHAEIRKHATTQRYFANDSNPLPEPTALATKKDIDRWIQKLNQRLRKAKPMSPTMQSETPSDAHIEDLRHEIDFYVREIVYYKLDIRGYKSDIKKLNKITAQLGSYGNRASDLDSDTSSLRPAPTPCRVAFLSTTPELRGSGHPSPALTGPISANMGSTRALTPPTSTTAGSPEQSPSQQPVRASQSHQRTVSMEPMTPQTPTKASIIESTYQVQDKALALALAMGRAAPSQSRDTALPTTGDESRSIIERDSSDAPTVRPVVPTSKFSRDFLPNSPSSGAQDFSQARVASGSSELSFNIQPQSTAGRAERKLSSASSTGIPFVLAMSSPHNPAIAVAAKNMPAVRPLRSASSTSRAGIDGTMASSTPLSSPTSIGSTSPGAIAPSPVLSGHKRKLSLSFRRQESDDPTTPTHSRSLSGGSIRTAIRWPKGAGKMKEKEKENEVQIRKDSIGMPQFLSGTSKLEGAYELPSYESRGIDFAVPHGGERA